MPEAALKIPDPASKAQEIVLRLVEDLGMDERILRPLRKMYKELRRRFKLPLGVGEESIRFLHGRVKLVTKLG